MSQQLTKLPGARCAANCASHGLNQVKSQPSSQRTAPWKRVGNSRRPCKAADTNSSLLFLRFSSTLSCCGMRTASSSDAPSGQKASGHVPWGWAERRRPSPRRKGGSPMRVGEISQELVPLKTPNLRVIEQLGTGGARTKIRIDCTVSLYARKEETLCVRRHGRKGPRRRIQRHKK